MKKAAEGSAAMWGWVLQTAFAVSSEPRPNLEGFVTTKLLLKITLSRFPDEISLDFQVYNYSQISAAFPNAYLDSASSVWILQGFMALYALVLYLQTHSHSFLR